MQNRMWAPIDEDEIPSSLYKYRTISVEHLQELQDDFSSFDIEGKVSNNPTFRKYISTMNHTLPESFPDAKSVVVMAVYTPLLKAYFHYKDVRHEVLVPHYYNDGITETHLIRTVKNQIIGKQGYRIENAKIHVLLKRLAVRSGLGKYGRNNLCFVEGMGSFVRLHAFFTDYRFAEDNWTEAMLMDRCANCKICLRNCPTGSISEKSFIVDVERCIPLYNEIPGEFPKWIESASHSALMGCMRCQLPCPANSSVIEKAQILTEVAEEETESLIEESLNEEQTALLSEKTRMFIPEEAWYYVPVLARNLRALITR
ncbi:MAG: 4Fe-4S double cluster binding domain-containing protein [Candidatus Thorarchaeota archaeon]